ncbi:hypothetical protein [Pseudomonas sp. 2FE]|uniref:hypothetical protein n=1 Tax=Pseudomonas sp. 2FE TaxID=2502190 RepID=UPI0010F54C5B|nr:hypothetical protein [Pseudomonas sp. 2FE]
MNQAEKEKRLQLLLVNLERLIGDNCYNSNIQNYGPGGEWEGEGREFRYPIAYRDSYGNERKEKYFWPTGLDEQHLKNFSTNGHYKFGANQLMIMQGLRKVIKYLEDNHALKI